MSCCPLPNDHGILVAPPLMRISLLHFILQATNQAHRDPVPSRYENVGLAAVPYRQDAPAETLSAPITRSNTPGAAVSSCDPTFADDYMHLLDSGLPFHHACNSSFSKSVTVPRDRLLSPLKHLLSSLCLPPAALLSFHTGLNTVVSTSGATLYTPLRLLLCPRRQWTSPRM